MHTNLYECKYTKWQKYAQTNPQNCLETRRLTGTTFPITHECVSKEGLVLGYILLTLLLIFGFYNE